MKVVILGGSGTIGRAIKKQLRKKKINYLSVSKKKNSLKKTLFLNLASKKEFKKIKLSTSDVFVILFGYIEHKFIDDYPNKSIQLNFISTINIIKKLIKKNIKIIYYSSIDVFGKDKKIKSYMEHYKKCPQSLYGKLKSKVENYIIKNSKNYLIIRSGWVISKKNNCIILRTMKDLKAKNCYLVKNLKVNIVSSDDIGKKIYFLIKNKVTGIVHLGPNEVIKRTKIADLILKKFKNLKKYKITTFNKLKTKKTNLDFVLNCKLSNKKFNFNYEQIIKTINSKINSIHATSYKA